MVHPVGCTLYILCSQISRRQTPKILPTPKDLIQLHLTFTFTGKHILFYIFRILFYSFIVVCVTAEPIKQCGTAEPIKHCGTAEPIKHCGTAEPIKHCSTEETIKHYGTAETIKHCGTAEPIKRCGTAEPIKHCDTAEPINIVVQRNP